jgi:hypothetical protein
LEALSNLGLLFGPFTPISGERSQALSQHRERGGRGCAKEKDDRNHGQENDDGNYDFHGFSLESTVTLESE